MICYKDQTFCAEPCGNAECSRRYTEQDEISNTGLPIAWANMRSEGCGYVPPEPEAE